MTFIASSTAILETGAKPVFVDVESQTGNLDATKIEAAITPRTRSICSITTAWSVASCWMRSISVAIRLSACSVAADASVSVSPSGSSLLCWTIRSSSAVPGTPAIAAPSGTDTPGPLSSLFTGTRWEGDLTELEMQWGRTIGQMPSPYTSGNPLIAPYHFGGY